MYIIELENRNAPMHVESQGELMRLINGGAKIKRIAPKNDDPTRTPDERLIDDLMALSGTQRISFEEATGSLWDEAKDGPVTAERAARRIKELIAERDHARAMAKETRGQATKPEAVDPMAGLVSMLEGAHKVASILKPIISDKPDTYEAVAAKVKELEAIATSEMEYAWAGEMGILYYMLTGSSISRASA